MCALELPPTLYTSGFSGRKIKILSSFAGGNRVCRQSVGCPDRDAALILWGSSPIPASCHAELPVIRVEDGFLRSVGLGADLVSPVSWVFDRSGIYYDATRPSDLELLLQNNPFSAELCLRAARLRERIVAEHLTKYNVGRGSWQRSGGVQRVILVPGQVETDASLAYGAPGIKTNLGLLQAVRQANPDAWLVYKPHPDVLAGLRVRGQGEDQALQWCDEQVTDVAMGE